MRVKVTCHFSISSIPSETLGLDQENGQPSLKFDFLCKQCYINLLDILLRDPQAFLLIQSRPPLLYFRCRSKCFAPPNHCGQSFSIPDKPCLTPPMQVPLFTILCVWSHEQWMQNYEGLREILSVSNFPYSFSHLLQ